MLGFLGLIAAVAAAGWLLIRSARQSAPTNAEKTVTLLKGVIFFGIAAALFAAKLWPLAFMVLLAAGGVTAIEIWRERAIKNEFPGPAATAPSKSRMSREEAASVLGVSDEAGLDDIRAAHRRLISQLHPDKGGSDYLAAKINEAREILAEGKTEADLSDAPGPARE